MKKKDPLQFFLKERPLLYERYLSHIKESIKNALSTNFRRNLRIKLQNREEEEDEEKAPTLMDFPGVRHEFWGELKIMEKIINDMPQFVKGNSKFKEVYEYLQEVIRVIRENENKSAENLRDAAYELIFMDDMDED